MRTCEFRRATRRGVSIVAALSVATTLAVVSPELAMAEPARSADQLLTHYRQLSDQAEKSAESMNKAQAEYDKQRKIAAGARKDAAAAQKDLDAADRRLDEARATVDVLARASSRGVRANRLYALLVSDSPQNVLDNMSDLEVISRQVDGDIASVKKSVDRATSAKAAAQKTSATASAAMTDAVRKRGELQAKQSDLQLEAVTIRAVYQSMTGKQLAALRGPKYNFDPRAVPKGTSPEAIAVQAAISRIGDPYVWGATGPNQFDCSGLMVWAYKQAGKTLPRTSEAQMGGGTPVARGDLKPGDLIIYYGDAHHVGMYVGDGYVIHASTFGVPVAVVPIDKAGPYNSARRY
ncbi:MULTISPECIES: C40 family peptidase [unclassified Gordonia (in: high G+C Gram-positive bacteria)]|uniref:C40 family peptidase n=1 Tax=unclassified Gordonia (in: high G+C Gram-positive bacteria) TaxID=2657482 RepID=UPI001FFF4B90|nr:C40 family peptidase [Gordonia sp. PP30]UQE73619.1 C40 family peptidase [Gordonia sp. PP30]